ncbi:hypothetical protein Hanom_Chr09g00775301 [Helianthus anomalus]
MSFTKKRTVTIIIKVKGHLLQSDTNIKDEKCNLPLIELNVILVFLIWVILTV